MVQDFADLLNRPAPAVQGKAPCFAHEVRAQIDPGRDLFADGRVHAAHSAACDRLGSRLSIPVALALEQPHIFRVLIQPSVDHRLGALVDREGAHLAGLAFNDSQFRAVGIQYVHIRQADGQQVRN